MKEEAKNEVTQAILNWCDPANPLRTQAALVQKSGVSETEISYIARGIYTNGAYKGKAYPIKDGSFYKLATALGLKTSDVEVHWETKNFVRIQQVGHVFKERKKIGMVVSEDSGVGKSYGFEYLATFNDQIACIKVTKTMGAKDLLQEVASKIIGSHILKTNMSVRKLLEAVRSRVLSQPGYLIIFDEMEYAKSNLYDIIKEIIDFTYGHCGVIVCGLGLDAKIERYAERGKAGFAQLKRRIFTNIIKLRGLENADRAEILRAHNITNLSAVKWFNRWVSDYQMLSEYIKDLMRWQAANPDKEVTEMLLDQLFKAY